MRTIQSDSIRSLAAGAVLCLAALGTAADVPEFPGPAPEHAFLKRFVGEWTSTTECRMAPDQPLQTMSGVVKARMLGEFWVINELDMTVEGQPVMKGLQTIGYDTTQGKYVGTWVDSATHHLWKYTGTLEGNKLTLEAEGPNFMAGGKTALFRDIYDFKSDTEVALTSQMQGEDGTWITFMNGTSRRK